MSAQLAFVFPIGATFEEVSAAVAIHFGGKPVSLSTGEEDDAQRDPAAVFTGTSSLTVSTGASVATATPTTELDIDGLPWDERIHSSSKAKNDNGKWKLKKGIANSALLTQVTAELMAKRGAPGAGVPASQATMNNDSDAAQAARLQYAEMQANAAAGPMTMLTGDQFDKLRKGQSVDVLQAGLEWFDKWRAAFDAAYTQYGQQAVASHPIASAPPVMPQTPTPPTAGPDRNDVTGFAMFYGTVIAPNPAHLATFNETCALVGITNGLPGVMAAPTMLPALNAMLQAKGL